MHLYLFTYSHELTPAFQAESPVRPRTKYALDDLQLFSSDDAVGPQSQTQTSEELSSTDPIDLDDVLDATFLNADSPTIPLERLSDASPRITISTSGGLHFQNLHRWDRIPVAAFRQTRETVALENAGSDNTASTPMTARTLLTEAKAEGSNKINSQLHRKHSKRPSKFLVSPVLFPTPDSHPKTSPQSSNSSQGARTHRNKSKRDRKEIAHVKKTLM